MKREMKEERWSEKEKEESGRAGGAEHEALGDGEDAQEHQVRRERAPRRLAAREYHDHHDPHQPYSF